MSAEYKNKVTIVLKHLLPIEEHAMITELRELFKDRRYRIDYEQGCLQVTLWKQVKNEQRENNV